MNATFDDAMITQQTAEMPEKFFDRFMFNLHPEQGTVPSLVLGAGTYPPKDVVDGFVVLSLDSEQRNLRFSTELSDTDGAGVGPLRWETVEDNTVWRVVLGPNRTGLELDLTWNSRAPYWLGSVEVDNADGNSTSFDHLFQPGRYQGAMLLDGEETAVDGWYGQRDRSRGVRTMSGGQGLHLWFQAQFPDRAIGFLLVEDRSGVRNLLEGAVMHEDGEVDDITDVLHAIEFDGDNDLRSGTAQIATEAGREYRVCFDSPRRGGYMAGGGYGGHHGKIRGRDHEEYDVYPLEGTVTAKTLDSALTDRCCEFTWDGAVGYGILEYALTRSSSYTYSPSLAE